MFKTNLARFAAAFAVIATLGATALVSSAEAHSVSCVRASGGYLICR